MQEKIPLQSQEQKTASSEKELVPKLDKQEETPVQLPRNFDVEIHDIETKIQVETEGLNAAHANLGISPENDSATLRELRNKRETLIAERDMTEDRNTFPEQVVDVERQEAEQALQKRLQRNIEQIGNDLSRFGRALQQREDDQLTPLLERDEISSALASARSMSDSISSGKIDFERLGSALSGIYLGLENYGRSRSRGQVHEDEENLRQISAFARSASDELYDLRRTLKQSTDEAATGAVGQAENLAQRLEDICMSTAKRLDAWSNYR